MNVIASRAIPDVRDGFKPVHQRVLYSAWIWAWQVAVNKKNQLKFVGEVIGKCHPHSDTDVIECDIIK